MRRHVGSRRVAASIAAVVAGTIQAAPAVAHGVASGPPDAAMLVGRYRMDRPGRVTHGINTRLLRKFGDQWLITMNHVSAYDEPTASPSERGAR